MSMTMASTFWLDVLQGYDINQPLSLPFDRHRVSDEQRTGRGTSASFHFGQHLSNAFLNYVKTNEITPEELSLACYFAFLFKLTNGEKDLCIGMNTKGRYKNEFDSVIGLFVNTIPLRLKNLDPSLSFNHLVDQMREVITNTRQMSYYPLQRILRQHSSGVSSPAFLDTSFEYEIIDKNINDKQISIGESILSLVPYSIQVQIDEIVSKFDFSLRIQHDQTVDELSCEIDASLDLFDKTTVETISKRFQTMLHQLFFSSSFDKSSQPIYELSLLLSDEIKLIESINEKTMEIPFDLLGQLHREFIHQACLHPQKLSICLDEQSLTYAELLVKVCQLVAHLGKRSYSNEVICQCVERSIEMIIGQLGIVMSGGVYCALSPDDPPARLSSLVHQTKSPFVLIHPSTVNHFSSDQPVINLHDCLLDEKRSVHDDEMIDSTISDNDVV
jgi:non-ribosomal peptide synthetase component F